MQFETEKKWTLAALIAGGLMLLTVILTVCHANIVVILIPALAGAAMVVATILNISDDDARIARYAWLIFPLLQFLCVLIMKGASYGNYSVWQIMSYVFGIFGAAEFVTLLLAKKVWETHTILIAGAILIVLTAVWVALKALALAEVCGTYAVTIAALALVLLNIYISNQFKKTAADKGYEGRQYFWLVFFLPLVGMILVAALPDRNLNKALLQFVQNGAPKTEETSENEC